MSKYILPCIYKSLYNEREIYVEVKAVVEKNKLNQQGKKPNDGGFQDQINFLNIEVRPQIEKVLNENGFSIEGVGCADQGCPPGIIITMEDPNDIFKKKKLDIKPKVLEQVQYLIEKALGIEKEKKKDKDVDSKKQKTVRFFVDSTVPTTKDKHYDYSLRPRRSH